MREESKSSDQPQPRSLHTSVKISNVRLLSVFAWGISLHLQLLLWDCISTPSLTKDRDFCCSLQEAGVRFPSAQTKKLIALLTNYRGWRVLSFLDMIFSVTKPRYHTISPSITIWARQSWGRSLDMISSRMTSPEPGMSLEASRNHLAVRAPLPSVRDLLILWVITACMVMIHGCNPYLLRVSSRCSWQARVTF